MGENPSKLKTDCLLSQNAFNMTANQAQMCLLFDGYSEKLGRIRVLPQLKTIHHPITSSDAPSLSLLQEILCSKIIKLTCCYNVAAIAAEPTDKALVQVKKPYWVSTTENDTSTSFMCRNAENCHNSYYPDQPVPFLCLSLAIKSSFALVHTLIL